MKTSRFKKSLIKALCLGLVFSFAVPGNQVQAGWKEVIIGGLCLLGIPVAGKVIEIIANEPAEKVEKKFDKSKENLTVEQKKQMALDEMLKKQNVQKSQSDSMQSKINSLDEKQREDWKELEKSIENEGKETVGQKFTKWLDKFFGNEKEDKKNTFNDLVSKANDLMDKFSSDGKGNEIVDKAKCLALKAKGIFSSGKAAFEAKQQAKLEEVKALNHEISGDKEALKNKSIFNVKLQERIKAKQAQINKEFEEAKKKLEEERSNNNNSSGDLNDGKINELEQVKNMRLEEVEKSEGQNFRQEIQERITENQSKAQAIISEIEQLKIDAAREAEKEKAKTTQEKIDAELKAVKTEITALSSSDIQIEVQEDHENY